ncbi:kunitz-type trypsin inhibitor-like 2 protein [Gastrolobium bilobum]|uniref:kunitz-type trypsin inhibitor-like 2 protein n=1 Tax=Gastrolobium bilobum TaxID=150636 RepID=UPI002AB018C5|nr:kunitz-type trypsin inhibitor-like 2 protein [Gastrolobium bilobum]
MKPALLTLSFFLFALITNLPLAFSSQVVEQVLDTNGKPIFPGGKYYILPAIFGAAGGGVRLGKTGNSKCPVTVLQDYSEVINGLPVKFSIPGISPGIIFTGTPLDIAFEKKPNCAESSKWLVVIDDFPREWVGIGGFEDHPGKQILHGTFHIQKYGFGYKLVFCPKNTAPPGLCFDIGRYNDEKGRRLILITDDNDPFQVVFVDADDTGLSSVV